MVASLLGQPVNAASAADLGAVNPNATILGFGTQGGFALAAASGPQTLTSTEAFTLNTVGLSGHLIAGLIGDQVLGAGFSSLNFSASVEGVVVVSQSFATAADAQAFFSGGVIDLGAFNEVAGLHVALSLSMVTSTAGDGFGESFVLGTTSTTTGNAAPIVVAPAPTVAIEDAAIATIDALAGASDPDLFDTLTVVGVPPGLPAGVTYNAVTHSFSLNASNAAYQHLAAGEVQQVAVGYGITDGHATTAATAVFNVTGTNDAPIVTGTQAFNAVEDGAVIAFNPLAKASDIDTSDVLTVVPGVLPAGIQKTATGYAFNPGDAAYQNLSAGEVRTVTWNYAISDGHVSVPTSVTFAVFGANDAPVVSGPVNAGTVLESAAPIVINLLANATDIDHLDTVSVNLAAGETVSVTSGTWSAPIAFTVANNQLTIDPKQFAALALGKTLGLTFNYQVTDGHANASVPATATVTIQGVNVAPALGVAFSPSTATLAKVQGGSALTSKTVLATVAQTNGPAGDAYTYTLGGAGAGSFSLAASGAGATLSTGTSAPTGSAGGQLYALTVTAKDTTTGIASSAAPLDVVVGLGKGANIVNLASLPSMVPSTPTFMYDLGGSDTINGSGMTGNLWISGGAGADTMTGGSGVNTYMFSATGDSTAKAMDVITNFHAGVDLLDFTGLGAKFGPIVALSSTATSLVGNSIGWQTSGGNTFVYVNTGGNSSALGSANMVIDLVGAVPLASNNFAHL